MAFLSAMVGAACLAYVVYLISGLGVAITAFIGIMLIVFAMLQWFKQMRDNMVILHNLVVRKLQ